VAPNEEKQHMPILAVVRTRAATLALLVGFAASGCAINPAE